ncbi:hypothetical protein RUM44_000923 [Polyplax serrata]|uniref:Uncharacterized protein n=1 Tax=Polyplax serrata TaxID=468196 RepID=A0ABR1B6H1_POLSC
MADFNTWERESERKLIFMHTYIYIEVISKWREADNKYSVASHHTTDYHDQLYFLEEEVLYALQRCWLTRRCTGHK